MTEHQQIKVLTLNVWGAPYATSRPARMQTIADKLLTIQPDIIALQECYLETDRRILIDTLTNAGWQAHYFASGVIGSGLLTFSRFPITKAAFHRFWLGGKPERLQHGDYYAGKGIGLTRLDVSGTEIDVYNIHPHAQYEAQHNNEYAVYTDSNLYEAADFINAHSTINPAILCGDYNVRPDQSGYKLITTLANLQDTFNTLHPHAAGITFSPENPYVKSIPQRLDYIMIRNGTHTAYTPHSTEITFTESPANLPAYSDHYGVLVSLELKKAETQMSQPNPVQIQIVLRHLQNLLQHEYSNTLRQKNTYTERALFSAASLGDLFIFRRLLHRLPGGKLIHRLLLLCALLFSLYNLIQAQLNLRTRQQTLEALLDEVKIQLK